MQRFFFDLYDDWVVQDPEGRDLPDVEAAKALALVDARQLISDQAMKGHINLNHRIEIQDEARKLVATIHFRDAVSVEA